MKPYHTGKPAKEGSKLKSEHGGSKVASETNKQKDYEFKVKLNSLMV
jgi:hypothetical protein